MTRWDEVRAFREHLRTMDPSGVETGLSPQGIREAWSAALDALDDAALADAAAIPGRAFPRAVVVFTRTVATAPIEWCAGLLGRGSAVTLKAPADAPGLAPLLAEAAAAVGLPLDVRTDRRVVDDADLVVAMGSDDTIAEIRSSLRPEVRFLAHGHRFSAAWVTGRVTADPRVPEGFRDPWGAVAADLALHDGRGCLSPAVVLTPLALEEACEALAAALVRAADRWPPGERSAGEGAAIRARRALARVVGVVRGDVHGLPVARLVPVALPRSVAVVSVSDPVTAAAALTPWRRSLSTVGTDDLDTAAIWVDAGATRICGLGRMQRPPMRRAHDGEDWVAAIVQAISVER